MVDDPAVIWLSQRLLQWTGLEVSQRLAEIKYWLQAHSPDRTVAQAAALAGQLQSLEHPLAAELVRSLTVSHTRFFRDAEQLSAVEELISRRAKPKLRIWVAGCSTGEEAYTVALLLLAQHGEFELIASDINTVSLEQARAGRYPVAALQRIPEFRRSELPIFGPFIQASPRLRRMIRFVEHNLIDAPLQPSDAAGWDLILCRNVLIHFQTDQAQATLGRLTTALAEGGSLFLGASEFHHRTPTLTPVHIAGRIALQRARAMPTVPRPARPALPLTPLPRPRAENLPLGNQLAGRLARGSLEAVLTDALTTLMADPEQQPALLLAGVAYHLKGRHREAAALLERTQLQHPSCWPATYFLALSRESLGQKEAARRAYLKLQEHTPPTPVAQVLIGLLDFGPWHLEAIALARYRVAELQHKMAAPT